MLQLLPYIRSHSRRTNIKLVLNEKAVGSGPTMCKKYQLIMKFRFIIGRYLRTTLPAIERPAIVAEIGTYCSRSEISEMYRDLLGVSEPTGLMSESIIFRALKPDQATLYFDNVDGQLPVDKGLS